MSWKAFFWTYNKPTFLFFWPQIRRTRITVPTTKVSDHDLEVVDIGNYAQVGMIAVDDDGFPDAGFRKLNVPGIAGDNTATVHVESGFWLNIEFNSSAVLTFNVVLYEVGKEFHLVHKQVVLTEVVN